jgi:hypothetical protein
MITTAAKIEAPSIQPFYNPSDIIPNTNDTTAAAHKILSISSSNVSITISKRVFDYLVTGVFLPYVTILSPLAAGSSLKPF